MMGCGYKETALDRLTNLLVVAGWGNRKLANFSIPKQKCLFVKMHPMRNTQERRNAQKREDFFFKFLKLPSNC